MLLYNAAYKLVIRCNAANEANKLVIRCNGANKLVIRCNAAYKTSYHIFEALFASITQSLHM